MSDINNEGWIDSAPADPQSLTYLGPQPTWPDNALKAPKKEEKKDDDEVADHYFIPEEAWELANTPVAYLVGKDEFGFPLLSNDPDTKPKMPPPAKTAAKGMENPWKK